MFLSMSMKILCASCAQETPCTYLLTMEMMGVQHRFAALSSRIVTYLTCIDCVSFLRYFAPVFSVHLESEGQIHSSNVMQGALFSDKKGKYWIDLV